MDKKVGRNDPCPCGSGKKFKKCCEERLAKKKFNAQILSSGTEEKPVTGKAQKISTSFFQRIAAPKPKQPEHQPPHDHPESEMPM